VRVHNGADAYQGAEKIEVPHESLQPGDACPDCQQGSVYEVSRPGVLVRITGQAPVQAKVYRLQKLRCNLCGKVFTARGFRNFDNFKNAIYFHCGDLDLSPQPT